MTYPTKAICPILLEDYRKITVERKGETNFFTSQMIKNCMKKVVAVNINQTIQVDNELEIKAYYGGHVLGAAMFHVKVGQESVVYTGDYNMTPDRHLGGAWLDACQPDLLITETTYATTIRDSKRTREREFLNRVHSTVEKGGKVLIPVFALGRAQELCILLETYWERMNLNIPIYFSAGLVEKANLYYKLFVPWTNEKIKRTFVKRNMFDFKHISALERGQADAPGAMVVFATPGMLHAGTSLELFKKWANNPLNCCVLPGYCVVGTVGNKLLAGHKGVVDIDKKTSIDVKCSVVNLSFSAHADAKGIIQLIRQSQPKNVMLVHGEKLKMHYLKLKIEAKFKINCYDPPNGVSITIPTSLHVPVNVSLGLLKRVRALGPLETTLDVPLKKLKALPQNNTLHGILLMNGHHKSLQLHPPNVALETLGLPPHHLRFSSSFGISSPQFSLDQLHSQLCKWIQSDPILLSRDVRSIIVRSITVTTTSEMDLQITWSYEDEELATHLLSIIKQVMDQEPTSSNVK
eukprot:TRINITY_DN521_c0_g1_i2.p1 TRINITY_DN521_c0_g1~~TRINITY_DN521_c0_g1_i2.p1  ORF type:complete len:521 (+),score=108.64 TRINITY_DN521_c0_g1_i2:319-1881(+)